MTNVANTQKKSTVQLIMMTMLTAALLTAGTAAGALGSDHPAFAHKKGYKGLNSKGISQTNAVNQEAACKATSDASPVTCSSTNTAIIDSTNSGGIAALDYSNGRQGISQPHAINQEAACGADGAAVRIDVSCSNTATITTTNNGGLVGGIPRP
ncbi:MAG: hypothetical protein WBZ20_16610 [Nitrososphaeraceae archaeon]